MSRFRSFESQVNLSISLGDLIVLMLRASVDPNVRPGRLRSLIIIRLSVQEHCW
jgi:hypothetical protein